MNLNYDFYTGVFYGELISEPLFDKFKSKAKQKVLFLLGKSEFTEDDLDVYEDNINMAICSVADVLYQIDNAMKNSNSENSTNIKSMSSGGESISFGENISVISKAIGDIQLQNKICYQVMYEYLYDTGLLYRGF